MKEALARWGSRRLDDHVISTPHEEALFSPARSVAPAKKPRISSSDEIAASHYSPKAKEHADAG
jgi:hypothetical protein